ncbi:CPBP family intramembrane glutamic endopeptidase [Sungkyunkwania multivorans]|uniref:CPBP family intramembrane glutamic endopeptidase n=1 Tax=Sungkyunkwania multivorans TaxID=1173618 RepID=A0ABW3CWU4_9FLAO
MFIAQAFKFRHEFWRYIVVSLLIILIHTLAQVPFMVALIFKEGPDILAQGTDQSALFSVLEPNLNLFLLLLPFAAALGALFLLLKAVHGQNRKSITTARPKIDWKRVWFAFGLWGALTLIITLVDYYVSPENYLLNFKLVPFLILVVIAVIFVPLQTSFEEYLFRGYLMQGFGTLAKNRWFPLLMTSVIFGGLHYFNPEVEKIGDIAMVYYIGTGLFLGILTLMDDGLELALGFHAANNLISALLVTADWTAFQTHSIFKDLSDPAAGFDILIPVLVVYPILLFVFAKKYKWTNWKERLFGEVVDTSHAAEMEELGN